jgi:acetylornithine deacetylase
VADRGQLQRSLECIVAQRLGQPYGADMRLFINEGGTPCVMYGPGDAKVAHSAGEHAPPAEVEECAPVLAAWVAREMGVTQA